MALLVVAVQPNSVIQPGTVASNVGGAANMAIALSDGSNSTYVSFATQARLDSEVVRLGFPLPTLPTGAQIYSVTLQCTIQTVVASPTIPVPVCNHWFRTLTGTIQVAGQKQKDTKNFFPAPIPVTQTTSAFVNTTIGTFYAAPDGSAWTLTNLTGFTYDLGRGDSATASVLNVSEVSLIIAYQQLSGVTVTGPTGTSTATRPAVTWTYLSLDSQPPVASRVCVYTSAQTTALGFNPMVTPALQDSGIVLGEGLSWTLNADLVDGAYAAYVQSFARWAGPALTGAPAGSFATAIASITWTRSATAASPPPSAVFSSATFDPVTSRVVLTFVPGGTTPATTAFTVQVSRNGGVSWTNPDGSPTVPSLVYIPANGMTPVTVYDRFYFTNSPSQYRVVAYSGSPYVGAIAPSATLSVTPTGDQHMLRSASNALLDTVLPAAPKPISDGIEVTKPRMEAIFYMLSASGSVAPPFVINGPSYGDSYAMEVFFATPTELATYWPALDQLDRAGGALYFQKPDGTSLWVSMGAGVAGQDPKENYNAGPGSPKYVYWRRRKFVLTQTTPPAYF